MATESFKCFAVAAPGLEQLIAHELIALGERPRVEDGGVSWAGDIGSVMRTNLWLRTASRVMVRVASFRATAFYELEKRAKKIPWQQFLAPGERAEFRVTARKSRLYHSDAIAQRLESASAAAGTVSPQASRALKTKLFIVRVIDDEFTISADSSGDLLHMRGYRQAVGKAPIRETLAAALLLASQWTGDSPLIDPFCGSGTIPIEAALIARRIAPGINRRFAFMDWPAFDAARWRKLVDEAHALSLRTAKHPILGSDRDAGAVAASADNAARAGVAADVQFDRRAISAIRSPVESGSGLIATNPPYGVRVGTDVRDLYAKLGNVARARFAGWKLALFAPSPKLTSQLGLELTELFQTSNGGLKVRALSGNVQPDGPAR